MDSPSLPIRTVDGGRPEGEMNLDITNLNNLVVCAESAETITWGGQRALALANGLVVVRDLAASDARIEVSIGAEGPAYPGIAFRVADRANYELGYAQPHTSGQWDAIQYDPVFHGSNTWQLYHGPAYQKDAVVPTDRWFTLRVDVKGDQAAFTVDDQPPLVVPCLMHPEGARAIGLWTFRPACFRDLRVTDHPVLPDVVPEDSHPPAGLVDAWFIEGFGRAGCEANGVLNLNRRLPVGAGEAVLTRQFETTSPETIIFSFGFSDELTLQLDGQTLFEGQQTFTDMNTYESRGYVDPDQHTLSRRVTPGLHTLTARLKVSEYFGWGMILGLQEQHSTLLPIV
jgi:hypothetical protein